MIAAIATKAMVVSVRVAAMVVAGGRSRESGGEGCSSNPVRGKS